MKITYIGDISPCKITVLGSILFYATDITYEVSEEVGKVLLETKKFKLAGTKEDKPKIKEEPEVVESASVISYDLNNDGKVDKEDASIAGKILYETTRKKK